MLADPSVNVNAFPEPRREERRAFTWSDAKKAQWAASTVRRSNGTSPRDAGAKAAAVAAAFRRPCVGLKPDAT
jgi:hypothetical protein